MQDNQKDLPEGDKVNSESDTEKKGPSYESYRKLLDEMKKVKAKNEAFEEEKRQQELRIEQERLEAEGKLKEAAELRQRELEKKYQQELEQKDSKIKEFVERDLNAKKLSSIVKGLKSQGASAIDDKWYSVIGVHLDDVSVSEDGEIDQQSVSSVVDHLSKEWPEMLKKDSPNLPNFTPDGKPNTIKRSKWLELPASEMRKYSISQIID